MFKGFYNLTSGMLSQGEEKEIVVCDYISGMTDQYAIYKFNEYFIPKAWSI